jgi:hypothetical protein
VPVDWKEDPDSRVHLIATATEDLRGIVRLLRAPAPQADGPVRRPLDPSPLLAAAGGAPDYCTGQVWTGSLLCMDSR